MHPYKCETDDQIKNYNEDVTIGVWLHFYRYER